MGTARNEVSGFRKAGDHPAGRAIPSAGAPDAGEARRLSRHILPMVRPLPDWRAGSPGRQISQAGPRLEPNSDRGSQYCSIDYQAGLRRHGIAISMSGNGNGYDNAMVETFFKTLKSELVWRTVFATRNEAERAIARSIDGFYNPVRRLSARLPQPNPVRKTGVRLSKSLSTFSKQVHWFILSSRVSRRSNRSRQKAP